MERQMRDAAKQFDFEAAAKIRDVMFELKSQ
jgi:excinuclease UvrABC helicase subunit UvrB